MYNPEIKTAFLQRYKENTQKAYARVFNLTMKFETKLDKDLYDFTIGDIEYALRSFPASTGDSIHTSGRTISAYLNWAIEQGYRKGKNPLASIGKEFFKYLTNTEERYFTKPEMDKMIEQCNNYQDSVILSLLFEGVQGTEICELRNLKKEHVHEDKCTLTLINLAGESREIPISEQCLKLICGAIAQKEYFKGNGEVNGYNLKATTELIETGYVIKPSKTRNAHFEQVSQFLIYGRLKSLEEYFGLDNLRMNTIRRSGMIWMGKQLLERDGVLEKEQYYEICERFGVSKVKNGNKLEYTWWGIQDFVNPEMITKLYG